jgi:hypothetical protein
MPQYRISNPARADIVDILRLSQTQFGDQARQRYQTLILAALQVLADTPIALAAISDLAISSKARASRESISGSVQRDRPDNST